MLLALRVKNFKSIRQSEVRFGALTCVVGHNGVGKSNLFDAVHFLSLLADRDIHQAATEVRRSSEGSFSPLDLVYGRNVDNRIELSADMIVPLDNVDDFGQAAKPSTTLLTYTVTLHYQADYDRLLVGSENLSHATLGEYAKFTAFPSSRAFQHSVAIGARRGGPLISTDDNRIVLHGDGGSRGRPAPVGTSPLTVVGGTNTFDYPTVLAAKREMSSWRLLQLEPSAMRTPDRRGAPPHVSASGGHLASTLAALQQKNPYARIEVVNRLRELNSDVSELDVHADEARDQLVLRAKVPGVKNWLYGRSLSDGTLRYVALAMMLADTRDRGVLCFEEPENGIHPSRIPSLVNLLYDYAVDLDEPVSEENPLRQVIVNTHSPEIARRINAEDLIFAESARTDQEQTSVFRPISGSWRDRNATDGPLPVELQAVADFIGGSPVREDLWEQLQFEFGTVS